MRNIRTAAIVFGALLALPVTGLASTAQAPTHEVKGVVRTVDATRLQIMRWPSWQRMSFALNPSTEREGIVKAGATVDVRYRTDANGRIATNVVVEHAKLPSASTSGAHQ